ncbi:MAG: MBL fold metallo-hydrolase [Planctomycetota bacterium]|nr:MBL fold metallo-hydrolase [Planctomycetota bacterium]
MLFHRFYYTPLAQACYLIADEGEAIVVDPPRDVREILAFAEQHQLRIRWALATHVHADFVAGFGELAHATKACVALGAQFDGSMPCERLENGQQIEVGGSVLSVLETPGHTRESVSFFIRSSDPAAPPRLLSGDPMLIGDVGRPDLVAGGAPRDMARALFQSVHEQIAPLPDETEVWPAHGAGSACGANISCEEFSTLGAQRIGNRALNEENSDQICDRLIAALRQPPRYFSYAAQLNRQGPTLVAELAPPQQLDAQALAAKLEQGAQLVDVRPRGQHAKGSWPEAVNLSYNGNDFETWCGTLLDGNQPILLHADSPDQAESARRRMLCIGFDAVQGFTTELPEQPRRHGQMEAAELFTSLQGGEALQVIDVRRPAEFEAGHIDGAIHAPLGPALAGESALDTLDRRRPTAVICRSGYRSSAATQQLAAAGFTSLANITDGMLGWTGNHLPVQS